MNPYRRILPRPSSLISPKGEAMVCSSFYSAGPLPESFLSLIRRAIPPLSSFDSLYSFGSAVIIHCASAMDKDELQDLSELSVPTDQDLEKRVPMTILFSDIKGSTRYAEIKGDVEYMAMLSRHNRLLFPIIEKEGGWVVKTIGDAILAKFDDPVGAVKAAAG